MSTARSNTGPAALFAALCALAFGLAAWLYGARLDGILSQVEASRIRFTLSDLSADFEKSMDRGFDIGQLANAQATLEAEARQDKGILALAVFDADGRQVFHTGHAIGAASPAARRMQVERTESAIVAATTLNYNHGAPAGTLVMHYSNGPHREIMAALALRLALAACAATMLSTFAFVACLRRLEERRESIGEQVDQSLGSLRKSTNSEPDVADLVDNVNQTAATALVELTAARHVLAASGVTP